MMIESKKLKLVFKDDMRRIKYEFEDFKKLSSDVSQIYQLNEEEFTLKYLDDENDLVSICSDIELNEFLKCNSESQLVKIHVVPKLKNKRIKEEEMEGERAFHHGGSKKAKKFFKDMRRYNLEQIIDNLIQRNFCKVVQNYICDGCNNQIVGSRFHCENCGDFDYCSSCFGVIDHNPSHQFQEITAGNAFKEAIKRFGVDIEIVKKKISFIHSI